MAVDELATGDGFDQIEVGRPRLVPTGEHPVDRS